MIEDKLNHDERLNLEALSQAIQAQILDRVNRPNITILKRAKEFADFIKTGEIPTNEAK